MPVETRAINAAGEWFPTPCYKCGGAADYEYTYQRQTLPMCDYCHGYWVTGHPDREAVQARAIIV